MSLLQKFRDNAAVEDCPIYDLHGHWGPEYGLHMPMAEDEPAVDYLNRSGVKLLVMCHHTSLFSPDAGNEPNIEIARKYPDRIRCYCGINPNYPDAVARDLERYDQSADVFVGFKFLSAYHAVRLDDERYRPVLDFANARGLPILMHTWTPDIYCTAELIAQTATKYPDLNILMGHSLHGAWDTAISLANEFPNVYMELTAVLDESSVLEHMVHGAGSEKVVYGTDFPWFSEWYYIGAVLGADITDEDRRNIFYRNAQRLISL